MYRTVCRFAVMTAWAACMASLGGTLAWAQAPTVDPGGGGAAEPAPAPEPQPQEPVIIQMPVQGQGQGQGAAGDDPSGFYYDDEAAPGSEPDAEDERPVGGGVFGPVPSFHVVRRGDTLWDICWFYFNNPWEWPKIWSYNPNVTNPHWIYPGDLVRLYPRGMGEISEPAPTAPEGEAPGDDDDEGLQPTPARRYGVSLRQTAFVDRADLEESIKIAGSVEEKSLLSAGDAVYLEYPKGKPPTVGKRYTIYAETQRVKHPGTAKDVGAYVKILGELKVQSVKKDKLARAVITESVDVIERGHRVGPLQKTFETVAPSRNEVDLQGTIVAMLENDQLIGQGQLIVIDKGKKDRVKLGNRLFVVRRGDAYDEIMGPESNVGQDDRRFPARAIGEILIVQVGKNVSVAMVTLSLQEIGMGDLVLMRKSRGE